MPEGPELFLSSVFINRICRNIVFSGKPKRNPIHKCLDISWDKQEYTISSESRGKELKVYLQSCRRDTTFKEDALSILFTFGMSGKFEFVPADCLPKHSHLTFFTKNNPKMALAFVDYRRFGKWVEGGQWSTDRGPCVMQEHSEFVKNVAENQCNNAFDKPICEVMLNQKFFNGIGNYLRAEILFRCKIAPFEKARSVLYLDKKEPAKELEEADIKYEVKAEFQQNKENPENHASCKKAAKSKKKTCEKLPVDAIKMEVEEPVDHKKLSSTEGFDSLSAKGIELLKLCGSVPLEVVDIGKKKDSLSEMYVDDTSGSFSAWLKCYYQDGMKNMADHNKRTIWFSGPAGPLTPKEEKTRAKKTSKKKKTSTQDETSKDQKTLSDSQITKKEVNSPRKRLTRKTLQDVKKKMNVEKREVKQNSQDASMEVEKSSTSRRNKRKSSTSMGKVAVKKVKPEESCAPPESKRLTRSRLKKEQ